MRMPPTREVPYSEEQLQRLQLAKALKSLVEHPAWPWWESRLTARVAAAQNAALHAPPAAAAETLRSWQLTDEIVSSIRYEIESVLDEWKRELYPNENEQELSLRSHPYGRRES